MPPPEIRENEEESDWFEGVLLDEAELHETEETRWKMEGYLKKKGQKSILGKKPWTKKFFSIDAGDGRLVCAEKHGGAAVSSLNPGDITAVLRPSGKARLNILSGRNKEHELEASSADEANEWQHFILECVVRHENEMCAAEEKVAASQLRASVTSVAEGNAFFGFMKQRCRKGWENRYFRLLESRKVVTYFNALGGRVLGVIPLEFVSAISRNLVDNRRFVLIVQSSPPRLFDFVAPSAQEATEWMRRLSSLQCLNAPLLLRKGGSRIWKDVPAAAAGARDLVSSVKASELTGAQLEDALKQMVGGDGMKRYELKNGISQSVQGTLQLDTDGHFISWQVRGVPTVRFPIANVSELTVGCKDKVFGEPRPPPECCFTVSSKKDALSLNLEAKSMEHAELWLSGIHTLIKRAGLVVAEQSTLDDSLQNLVVLMQQGSHFFRYEDTHDKGTVRAKVFMFYEPADKGLGTLYWGSPMVRSKTYALALGDVKQIMLGKCTPALQSKVAKSATPNTCCAIVAANFTLSLEAESMGKRGLWLNGIHKLLASVKKVDRNVVSAEQPAQPQVLVLSPALVGRFKKFDLVGTAAVKEDVLLWFSPHLGKLGSLCWGKEREESAERSLSLHAITDMYLGKRDQAFQVPGGQDADVNCCFTLFSRNLARALNLEAPDSNTRRLWLQAIHAHLTPQAAKRPEASTPPDLAATVAFLQKGRTFFMYEEKGRQEVFIYYRPSSKQGPGYLHWKDSVGSKDNPNNTFPLRQLREIVGGKQGTVWQTPEAQSTDSSCCFCLKGLKLELNLQADSKQTRHEWFTALHKVMSASGKTREPPKEAKAKEGQMPAEIKSPPREQFLKGSKMAVETADPESVFKLIAKIGQGSYGAVFKGLDRRDGKEVALKMLEYEPESIRDIQNEVDILKNCASPHIVALKGVFVKGKNIWIAMEYCAAGSLADMMAICRRTLTEKQIAAALRMSLLGLEYLHAQNIMHRDIKAANVLVTESGECKLADFGVSSSIQHTLSRKQTVIGTPNWMAPEVIAESEYNQSADVWSLGIVAIELAVGDPPLSDMHPMTAMFKIPNNPPPTLPGPQDKWHPDFRSFVRTALQKDPRNRPSCTELLKHPFVRNARNKSVIKELVDECLVEMRSFRNIDETAGSAAGNTLTYA